MTAPNFYTVKAAIERAMMDERDGRPCGCIIEAGCKAREYVDPAYAASGFIWEAADGVMRSLSAPPAIELTSEVDAVLAILTADNLPECSFDDGKTWEIDGVGVAETFTRAAALIETLTGKAIEDKPAPITYEPCGGCGATSPMERCFGCFHKFEFAA